MITNSMNPLSKYYPNRLFYQATDKMLSASESNQQFLPDWPELKEWKLVTRQHQYIRHCRLSLDYARDQVVFSFPPSITLKKAMRQIDDWQDWLYKRLQATPERLAWRDGSIVTLLGTPTLLKNCTRVLDEQHYHDPQDYQFCDHGYTSILRAGGYNDNAFIRRLQRIFSQQLLVHIHSKIIAYQDVLNVAPKKVCTKWLTARWGSCSSVGTICINARLIFAPISVVNYVIAHEMAHLLEMNHSRLFWQHVETLMPDYKIQRRLLTNLSTALMRSGPKLH